MLAEGARRPAREGAAPAISLDPHLVSEPAPTNAVPAAGSHPARPAAADPSVALPPKPVTVLRSRPTWTRARPIPAPVRSFAPAFQAREVPPPLPLVQQIVRWPTLVVLALLLVAASALLFRTLAA